MQRRCSALPPLTGQLACRARNQPAWERACARRCLAKPNAEQGNYAAKHGSSGGSRSPRRRLGAVCVARTCWCALPLHHRPSECTLRQRDLHSPAADAVLPLQQDLLWPGHGRRHTERRFASLPCKPGEARGCWMIPARSEAFF